MTGDGPPLRDYGPEARLLVAEVLEHYRRAAEKAKETTKAMLKVADLPYIRNQLTYWKNVEAGLRWVQKNVLQPIKETQDGEQADENRDGLKKHLDSPKTDGRDGDVHRQVRVQRRRDEQPADGVEHGGPPETREETHEEKGC